MAAGQGFKTFVTGEVLTAGDVNGYLMQGINVFTNATARDAAITAPAEGQFAFTKDNNSLWYYDGAAWVASGATGDIEGVTAGVGISGGGTSGTVTVTNSMATAIDAKGDLVPGTGADTFSRLAVGANDTILTADSTAATGMKWAAPVSGGGMTLLSTTTLSGSSVSVTGISQDYKNLLIITYLLTSGAIRRTRISPNGLSQARGNYTATRTSVNGTSSNDDIFVQGWDLYSTGGDANCSQTTIFNYSSTAGFKPFTTSGTFSWSSNGEIGVIGGGGIATESAITSITISGGGVSFTGGTMLIYGVK
jgi:hypothetical protein